MPIAKQEFVKLYPVLYHVSLAPNISTIRNHGLRSTSALLDLFGVSGARRTELESSRRSQSVLLTHPVHGTATLNDQSPLQEGPLCRCLRGMSPADWIRELNRRVFFFPTKKRVSNLYGAKLAQARPRIIVEIKSEILLELGADGVELCTINSGCTKRDAPLRGSFTFQTLHQFPFEERRKKYGPARAFAEVTFPYAVPPGDHFELASL